MTILGNASLRPIGYAASISISLINRNRLQPTANYSRELFNGFFLNSRFRFNWIKSYLGKYLWNPLEPDESSHCEAGQCTGTSRSIVTYYRGDCRVKKKLNFSENVNP